jgi:dienelactone hydrolase
LWAGGSAAAREFTVRSADGVAIHGEAGPESPATGVAVIFVAGTGLFDRDALLGNSGSPRDLVFKDLAARMAARGVAAIRYDGRGLRYGATGKAALDRALIAARTTHNLRDDLAAVYAWARSPAGFNARCVAFFAHSEGMLHVARLAAGGAPAPALVIGMGAGMQSPAQIVRWQIAGRDADSLAMMDADHDGVTTNDEVRANLFRTPSGAHGKLEPFLHPDGAWTAKDLVQLRQTQLAHYEGQKRAILAHADADPYPSAEQPFASYQWWKSWFVDDEPAAALLARWAAPVSLHYGDRDSQTPAGPQAAAARAHLDAGRLKIEVHAERGHTLGQDVLLGPMDEAIADRIADEAAAVRCRA